MHCEITCGGYCFAHELERVPSIGESVIIVPTLMTRPVICGKVVDVSTKLTLGGKDDAHLTSAKYFIKVCAFPRSE